MNRMIKLALFLLIFISGRLIASPCHDFLPMTNNDAELFYAEDDNLCVIDIRLAGQTKFLERQIVKTKTHGPMEFLLSENGNLAIVADLLSISERDQRQRINNAVDRVIREAVKDVVDCIRTPACREMVRDYVRETAIGIYVDTVIERIVEHIRDAVN